MKYKKIFLWTVLSLIAGVSKYVRIRYYGHIPIVWEPAMFVAILLTKGLGLKWGLLFLLIPNPISELVTGGMQFTMFIAGFQWTVYMLIAVLLGNLNIVFIGIIVCMIDVVVGYFQNKYVWGLPLFFLIYNISHLIVHTVYFSIFGEIVLAMLKAVA
ncbi:MAG: hypothetical protein KKF44_06830 [Nanoarchaeota archaeon]|nr:hypothetical protein [Nanoarchaeota archaeon]